MGFKCGVCGGLGVRKLIEIMATTVPLTMR